MYKNICLIPFLSLRLIT